MVRLCRRVRVGERASERAPPHACAFSALCDRAPLRRVMRAVHMHGLTQAGARATAGRCKRERSAAWRPEGPRRDALVALERLPSSAQPEVDGGTVRLEPPAAPAPVCRKARQHKLDGLSRGVGSQPSLP